ESVGSAGGGRRQDLPFPSPLHVEPILLPCEAALVILHGPERGLRPHRGLEPFALSRLATMTVARQRPVSKESPSTHPLGPGPPSSAPFTDETDEFARRRRSEAENLGRPDKPS